MGLLREQLHQRDAKDAIDNVLFEKGGMLRAQSAGDIPMQGQSQWLYFAMNSNYMILNVFVVIYLILAFWELIPTFNLGEFSVTAIVYQHLLLQSSRTGHSPLMLGPLLVHYQKEYRSYNYFLSALCALNRKIAAVKAVGRR